MSARRGAANHGGRGAELCSVRALEFGVTMIGATADAIDKPKTAA
ncbi:MAG: hypothetical protein ACLRP3_17395 [Escherichia sp.]